MPFLPSVELTGNMADIGKIWHEAVALTPTSTVSPPSTTQAVVLAGFDDVPLQTRSSLGFDPNFNASAVLARRQQYQVQVIASTFSSISIIAAVCALYWFCMMRRNFRRDLVLLLIIGDFWKSLWFLVFSTTTLSRGLISTTSSFCQASGYFLQVGLEACDCAIFLMSLHMSLQIFPPKRSSILGHDGLYRVRQFVLAGWIVVPNIMGALAFVNSGPAFISQGGFCSLPIRPIWYRLALSWIPRYLIWIFVMGVAIRIYRHVGFEFKVFGQENDQTSSVGIPNVDTSALNTSGLGGSVQMSRNLSSVSDGAHAEKQTHGDEDIAPDDDSVARPGASKHSLHGSLKAARFNEVRRSSVPTWTTPFSNQPAEPEDNAGPGALSPTSKSLPSSRRGSRQIEPGVGAEDFAPPPPVDYGRTRGSISTMASMKSSGGSGDHSSPALAPITEHRTSAATTAPPVSVRENVATTAMQQRRRAIQRQLRLLFIYPMIYLILWVMPFVSHALNYSNHFAQHPIFAISVLNIFCQNIMGFTDVCIFCWREKPWRHIPGSDGTFFGSFMFWRYCVTRQWQDEQRRKSSAFTSSSPKTQGTGGTAGEETKEFDSSQSGLLSSIKRWSMSFNSHATPRPSNASLPVTAPQRTPMHRRTRSGGSDRRILESERAHERLAMERADNYSQQNNNQRSLQERSTSVLSSTEPTAAASPERKEWWDRCMSVGDIDLQINDADDGNNGVKK